MTYILNNKIGFNDDPSNDAFGRLRVSNQYTLIDSKQLAHPLKYYYGDYSVGGNYVYNVSGSSSYLNVTGGTGSISIRQSKQRFNYQSGKSMLILLTGVFSTNIDVIKRVGYYDSDSINEYNPFNGVYFENNSGILSFNVIKNGVVNKITQENWNVDKLNGNGISKQILNISKSQIIVIDAEWLGVGRVRVGFNIDGMTYYCHYFNHANNTVGVYTRYLNLPITYEIRSTGGNGTLEQICSTVSSEGGVEPTGIYRTIERKNTISINSGLYRPILAIRLKTDSLMGSVFLENFSVLGIGKNDYFFNVKLYEGNNTVNVNSVPTTWDNIILSGITDSYIEYKNNFDTSYSVIDDIDNGIPLIGGFISNSVSSFVGQLKNSLNLGSKITGERDIIVIEVKSLTANDDLYGSLTWREI